MTAYDGELVVGTESLYSSTAGYHRPSNGQLLTMHGLPAGTAPTVTLVSPTQGRIDSDTPIVLDVTDDVALSAVVVLVRFPDGSCEGAYDGTAWSTFYSSSTSTPISGGYRLRLVRSGGWPRSPSVQILAIDSSGTPAA